MGVCADEGSLWFLLCKLEHTVATCDNLPGMCKILLDFTVPGYGMNASEGLTNEELDEVIRSELAVVAPSWPDQERLDDAAEALR